MSNSMVAQRQNLKLQMKPQAVYSSDIYLSKVNSQNIFVSGDVAPDIDPVQGSTLVLSEPSNTDPHTSRLRTHTRLFTPLSCDLEPDINKPTYRNIVISDDLDTDMSASIDSGQVITRVFFEPFLLNSSFHYFEKLTKDEK